MTVPSKKQGSAVSFAGPLVTLKHFQGTSPRDLQWHSLTFYGLPRVPSAPRRDRQALFMYYFWAMGVSMVWVRERGLRRGGPYATVSRFSRSSTPGTRMDSGVHSSRVHTTLLCCTYPRASSALGWPRPKASGDRGRLLLQLDVAQAVNRQTQTTDRTTVDPSAERIWVPPVLHALHALHAPHRTAPATHS